MYRRVFVCSVGLLMLGAAVTAQVRVVGGSLKALEGTNTLVTVVLRASLARDVNLTVSSVENSVVRLLDEQGTSVVYKFADIAEVRVQSDRIADSGFAFSSPLQREDVAGAISKAAERAAAILAGGDTPPRIRILALQVGAAVGNSDAIASLERFALSDDASVALDAFRALYLVGREPDTDVLKLGLRSPNRDAKGAAARYAGYFGEESLRDQIVEMIKDPAPEIFAGAAYGCAYFGDERAIPYLLRALNTNIEDKADAAVFALSTIGGEAVRREALTRVQTASGNEWYNAVRVLYAMDDPRGIELMRGEMRENSPFAIQTALILAEADYWDANVYLRKYLENSTDTSLEGFKTRSEAASILLSKGYVQAKAYLRDIFAMEPSAIYIRGQLNNEAAHHQAHIYLKAITCGNLSVYGDVSILQMLRTTLEDQNSAVALMAGHAIVSIGNPGYRDRVAALSF